MEQTVNQAVNKEQFSTGVFWKLCEYVGPTLVSLILQVVLARLLSPEDYGVIAIAAVFIAFCDVLVQNGFCTSLMQNKDTQKVDYSVAMTLSMLVAIVLYIIVFFTAPLISSYYTAPSLTNILRVLGILVFLNGTSAIMNAYLSKTFKFKLMFIVHMISSVISGAIGILMAYLGFGAWALVAQRLSMQVVFIGILAIILKWSFRPSFNRIRAKIMLGYGVKILGGALVAFVSDNMYAVVIGRQYSKADVGYVNKAEQLPSSMVMAVSNALGGVLLPAVASFQDDRTAVEKALRRVVKTMSFIMFPVVFGMFGVADNLIIVLFSDTFSACIPLLRVLCLLYITIPFQVTSSSVLKAIGKSRLYFWLEVVKMVLTVVAVGVLVYAFGLRLEYLVLARGVIAVIMTLISLVFTKKYCNYGAIKHIKDISVSGILSGLMCLAVWEIGYVMNGIHPLVTLIVQMVVGFAVYIALSWSVGKMSQFNELTDTWGIVKMLGSKFKRQVATMRQSRKLKKQRKI